MKQCVQLRNADTSVGLDFRRVIRVENEDESKYQSLVYISESTTSMRTANVILVPGLGLPIELWTFKLAIPQDSSTRRLSASVLIALKESSGTKWRPNSIQTMALVDLLV